MPDPVRVTPYYTDPEAYAPLHGVRTVLGPYASGHDEWACRCGAGGQGVLLWVLLRFRLHRLICRA